jgi:hypothetical protein
MDRADPTDLTPLIDRLAADGTLHVVETGGIMAHKGVQVKWLHVLLSGHVVLSADRGSGPRKAIEWHAGEVSGIAPYSRMNRPSGDAIAQEPTEVLSFPRGCLPAQTHECCEATAIPVHNMLDRARPAWPRRLAHQLLALT